MKDDLYHEKNMTLKFLQNFDIFECQSSTDQTTTDREVGIKLVCFRLPAVGSCSVK